MDNNNLNIDNDTMNQIKNLVNGGNISDALSKISPEMIQNFSNMMNSNGLNNNSQNNMNQHNNQNNNHNNNQNNSQNGSGDNSIPNFDFSNIDMNTIMKISSAF